ncbi:hypothetical protein DKG82_12825 [Salmonella enterica subsp. enterica serovar Lexington]|nr:hypothetical protein [Salmonella enterica subsp. enterica serovar Lexington]EAA7887085.1 hypothetical protein [Salmonella enterica]EBS5434654.1 hypothetical protein [Salmonella enterica subsp. enterica serovar Binza]EBW4913300.1 hypothetical protein [Salmonella enterica subsp. enterica serovar Vom]ECC3317706.1 hypothetical protein [Salmonella enterica subsp. enterica]ECD3752320.1 hypothetical protein [Salmonella enterica subsp. enterica serovar Orion]
MRSNGPEGGGQDARHKLPGISLVKKPIRQDGLFCVLTGVCTAEWRLRLIRPTGIIPPTKLVFL